MTTVPPLSTSARPGSPEREPLAPGEATRRFLITVGESRPPADPREPAPAFKRYADTTRLELPADGVPTANGLMLAGWLLRNLLGLVRFGWTSEPARESGIGWIAGPSALPYRPVASGGRCYPLEAYLATGSPDVPAGLFHYDPAHHVLELVRDTDHRPALDQALAPGPDEPDRPGEPELMIVLTAVFWRTGFSYGDFAYRLQCQEAGALIAQFLALTEILGRSGRAHLCFDGPRLGHLLGLDPAAEGVLAVLSLRGPVRSQPASSQPASPQTASSQPASPQSVRSGPDGGDLASRPPARPVDPAPPVHEILSPLLTLHTAATSAGEVAAELPALGLPVATGTAVELPATPRVRPAGGIRRRASAPAGFAQLPIDLATVTQLLGAAAEGYPSEFPTSAQAPVMGGLYVIALRVEGLTVGGYRYRMNGDRMDGGRLEPVGDWPGSRVIARSLPPRTALVFGEAAVVLLPVGDPLAGVPQFGDRWYRLQQTEAGIVMHRAALAASALGLAARMYSDLCTEATDAALGLGPTPARALSALAVGAPPRRTPLRWAG